VGEGALHFIIGGKVHPWAARLGCRSVLHSHPHPAVLEKSADPFDCKRVVKHSLCKERKEERKSAEEGEKREVRSWTFEVRATSGGRRVPEWELLVYTPVVFVRVANKGVAGYGK